MSVRPIKTLARVQPTVEGAGVHLRRAFGFGDTSKTDPFLLFDDLRNDQPSDYLPGFPWHTHRGIETIKYVLYMSWPETSNTVTVSATLAIWEPVMCSG